MFNHMPLPLSGTSAGKLESSERTLYEGVACLKSSTGEVQKPGQDRITPACQVRDGAAEPLGAGPTGEGEPLDGWGEAGDRRALSAFSQLLTSTAAQSREYVSGVGRGVEFRCSICKRLVMWRDKQSELRVSL